MLHAESESRFRTAFQDQTYMSAHIPYSNPFPYEPFESSLVSQLWHPKLTLYRILILSTTIGLGIVKAYATSQGLISASTTIEWVAGVALFSVLS